MSKVDELAEEFNDNHTVKDGDSVGDWIIKAFKAGYEAGATDSAGYALAEARFKPKGIKACVACNGTEGAMLFVCEDCIRKHRAAQQLQDEEVSHE